MLLLSIMEVLEALFILIKVEALITYVFLRPPNTGSTKMVSKAVDTCKAPNIKTPNLNCLAIQISSIMMSHALCYVKAHSAKMMIPATYECPSEWKREYHGYLMSQYYSLPHPSEYICVDIDAEALPGTKVDVDGATLYHVEGRCGALPCLPYVDGQELTCAVCIK